MNNAALMNDAFMSLGRAGRQAEVVFAQMLQQHGWINVAPASSQENMVEHWDLKASHNNKDGTMTEFRFEVKCQKRLRREDDQTSAEWVWIEFKNIRGNPGWLYGKADIIAFEMADHFLLVKRQDLSDLADKLVDRFSFVREVEQAQYRVYQRRNRMDQVSLIEINQILTHLVHKKYPKPPVAA